MQLFKIILRVDSYGMHARMHACMHTHKMPTRCNVHYAIHVKAMGQLGSLLPQHRSSGSGSSCQAWGQVPFSR